MIDISNFNIVSCDKIVLYRLTYNYQRRMWHYATEFYNMYFNDIHKGTLYNFLTRQRMNCNDNGFSIYKVRFIKDGNIVDVRFFHCKDNFPAANIVNEISLEDITT